MCPTRALQSCDTYCGHQKPISIVPIWGDYYYMIRSTRMFNVFQLMASLTSILARASFFSLLFITSHHVKQLTRAANKMNAGLSGVFFIVEGAKPRLKRIYVIPFRVLTSIERTAHRRRPWHFCRTYLIEVPLIAIELFIITIKGCSSESLIDNVIPRAWKSVQSGSKEAGNE